jgi:hypothetical protein
MKFRGIQTKVLAFVSVILVSALPGRAGDPHEHGGDLSVFRDGSGQLAIEFDFAETLPLEFVTGLLNGCTLDSPGFNSPDFDEPDENLFQLSPNADIVFEVVSIDAGLKVHTPGFADILDAPGDQWVIGPPAFDTHPVWHIDSDEPGFDPGAVYSIRFKLLDLGSTAYLESEVYTLQFQCAARGACCVGGVCEDGEFEDPCGDEGGIYQGDGTDCAAVNCAEPIPTVSEWGLAILTLTGLIAGTLLFNRSGQGQAV